MYSQRFFKLFINHFLPGSASKMRSSLSFKDFIVFITGCTGAGKSDLGVEIAKKFNGEIINADSMQIYKGIICVSKRYIWVRQKKIHLGAGLTNVSFSLIKVLY